MAHKFDIDIQAYAEALAAVNIHRTMYVSITEDGNGEVICHPECYIHGTICVMVSKDMQGNVRKLKRVVREAIGREPLF